MRCGVAAIAAASYTQRLGARSPTAPHLLHAFAGALREEQLPVEEPDDEDNGEGNRGKREEGETRGSNSH